MVDERECIHFAPVVKERLLGEFAVSNLVHQKQIAMLRGLFVVEAGSNGRLCSK